MRQTLSAEGWGGSVINTGAFSSDTFYSIPFWFLTRWLRNFAKNNRSYSIGNNNRLLTELARAVLGILARGRGSTALASSSSVSKLFIIWHSVSDSKMHFRWLALKGLRPWRIRDDASSSDKSKLPRVRKTNLLNVKSSKISLNKTSKTLCNGIWQKQLLILKLEKGFLVDQTIFSWLQNMDQVSVKWSCEN